MRPTNPNAFFPVGSQSAPEPSPQRCLASMLASLHATVHETDFGARLELFPGRMMDAMAIWSELAPGAPETVLIGDQPLAAAPYDVVARVESSRPVRRGSVSVLIGVDGPVEPSDVNAMTGAIARGDSPLNAELRAVLSVRQRGLRTLVVDARDLEAPTRMVGEMLRQYVAAILRRGANEIDAPPVEVIRPLLEGGTFRVRPIETDVMTTMIDIGVKTTPDEIVAPAETALLYDMPSTTWHLE